MRTVMIHGKAVLVDAAMLLDFIDLAARALDDVDQAGDVELGRELRRSLREIVSAVVVEP